MTDIKINGRSIKYIKQYDLSIESFNSSLESTIDQINTVALESYLMSIEANEEKTHSIGYTIVRKLIEIIDRFYQWLVTFVKKIIEFFKRIIKILTGRTGPQDITINYDSDYVILVGKVGLKTKKVKISLDEFDRIVGLSNQNGKHTMVKFMDENKYLSIIQNYTNTICDIIDDPNFIQKNSDEINTTISKLESDVNHLKNELFIDVSDRRSLIKNLQLFGKNPDNYAKDISVKVVNLTTRMEKTEKKLLVIKDALKESVLARLATNYTVSNITKIFTLFKEFDNILLNSSAGITKISFEFMTLFNREAVGEDNVLNALAYTDRSINVLRNGTDNYTIQLKNITLDDSFIPENDLKILIEEGRAINAIVNEEKGQVIDKNNGGMSSENEHVITFMNLLQKYSRKVRAVVGTNPNTKYVIYNFDIKIKRKENGKEYVVVNGQFINDNRKKLEFTPSVLYHTSGTEGLTELMPSAGNVSTGNKSQGGIHGIGINSKRVYASKTPVLKQGFSIMPYIEAVKKALRQIEGSIRNAIKPQTVLELKKLEATKYVNALNDLYIYRIDPSAYKNKPIYVDPEHHGGLSGKANSILTGGKDVTDNLVYIETDEPIPVTDITDEIINKLKNNSDFPEVKKLVFDNKLEKLKFMFK